MIPPRHRRSEWLQQAGSRQRCSGACCGAFVSISAIWQLLKCHHEGQEHPCSIFAAPDGAQHNKLLQQSTLLMQLLLLAVPRMTRQLGVAYACCLPGREKINAAAGRWGNSRPFSCSSRLVCCQRSPMAPPYEATLSRKTVPLPTETAALSCSSIQQHMHPALAALAASQADTVIVWQLFTMPRFPHCTHMLLAMELHLKQPQQLLFTLWSQKYVC